MPSDILPFSPQIFFQRKNLKIPNPGKLIEDCIYSSHFRDFRPSVRPEAINLAYFGWFFVDYSLKGDQICLTFYQ